MALHRKKRTKSSRYRGTHTHGRGFKKKARGSGHRGGFGMAGTGKRGDQKKTMVLNLYGNDYFGKDTALRRKVTPKPKALTLAYINENIHTLIKQEKAIESKGAYELNLEGFKVIGDDDVRYKLKVKATAASKTAIAKIKKAGGEVILEETDEMPEEKKEDKK